MNKDDKIKFLIMFLGIALTLLLVSCVDTGVENIPQNISYTSQVKFVNLVPNAGTATINLNGSQVGTADPGGETPVSGQPFMEVSSGPKTLDVSLTGATVSRGITTETDYKMRLFVVWDSVHVVHIDPVDSSVVLDSIIMNYDVIKSVQRYVWQNKGTSEGASLFPADTIQIFLFNGSPDAEVQELRIYGGGADVTATLDESVTFEGGSGYVKFAAPGGDYNVDVVTADTTFTMGPVTLATQSRYTAVIYDYTASIKGGVFKDD